MAANINNLKIAPSSASGTYTDVVRENEVKDMLITFPQTLGTSQGQLPHVQVSGTYGPSEAASGNYALPLTIVSISNSGFVVRNTQPVGWMTVKIHWTATA